MNDRERQIKINDTLRRYESQEGGPCRQGHVIPHWGKDDVSHEHELVKYLVCEAIATGKHLVARNPEVPDMSGQHPNFYELSDIIPKESVFCDDQHLVWENDHVGEKLSFITEAIKLQESGSKYPWGKKGFAINQPRIDVVRLEFPKEIEIMDKNVKMKDCPKCDGFGHDPRKIVPDPKLMDIHTSLLGEIIGPKKSEIIAQAEKVWEENKCLKCKGLGKVPDYPADTDVVVI